MYNLKVVKGNREELIPVQSITVTHLVSEKKTSSPIEVLEDIGITLAVKLTKDSGRLIVLPDRSVLPEIPEELVEANAPVVNDYATATEADVVYVTNERGVTIDSYRWPPRKRG